MFQQGAVCLTKFGPESGETTKEILTRKDLERRSGTRAHKNELRVKQSASPPPTKSSTAPWVKPQPTSTSLRCDLKTAALP